MTGAAITPELGDWIRSGALGLTGREDMPPLVPPAAMIERIKSIGEPIGIDVVPLLVERAAIGDLHRRGDVSCGGSARLLEASGGWMAVSLPRNDDWESVAAWVGAERPEWSAVGSAVAQRTPAELVERAELLGLAVAEVAEVVPPADPVQLWRFGEASPLERPPLVVDLSSLWAGPLCARLLAGRGARVLKVEATSRPDGARNGPPGFFDLMHAHAPSVALDFASTEGRAALRSLLERADVVIEASRPRALRQLGIEAESMLANGPTVWVSITGYGRDSARVAFGDDAAAAGGLVAWDSAGPCFALDAVADPLSGVAAAACVTGCLEEGGRWMLEVAMARVAAFVAGTERNQQWSPAEDPASGVQPRIPTASQPARPLGADNEAVASELGIRLP